MSQHSVNVDIDPVIAHQDTGARAHHRQGKDAEPRQSTGHRMIAGALYAREGSKIPFQYHRRVVG